MLSKGYDASVRITLSGMGVHKYAGQGAWPYGPWLAVMGNSHGHIQTRWNEDTPEIYVRPPQEDTSWGFIGIF